jgi:PAS domain S-box-containing protein
MTQQTTDRQEQLRLEALKGYDILDTISEEEYDELTRLAAQVCSTPICLISLVDEQRQWFKSVQGLDVRETPREYSFCAHAIRTPDEPLIVNDARLDDRFKNNPLVTDEPKIVFYAGVPLLDEQNQALGSFCVIDRVPRELNSQQLDMLRILAKSVVRLMQARKANKALETKLNLLSEALTLNNSFFLILDRQERMVEIGLNFKKVLPDLEPGQSLHQHFKFEGDFDLQAFLGSAQPTNQRLVFLSAKSHRQRFKCTLKKIEGHLVIASTPVVNAEFKLKDYGLKINDFAQHDYIAEYLFLQQTTDRSLKDSRDLTEKLVQRNQELVKLEQALVEKQEFYEFVLNNIPADIAVFSKDHKYLFVNPQGIQNKELREFMIGKDDFDYCKYKGIPDDLARQRRAFFNRILQNSDFVDWEDDFVDGLGNRRVVFRKMGPIFNEQGEVTHVIGYGVTITDRKIAEERLQEANRRMALLEKFLNRTSDAIQVAEEDGRIVFINLTASNWLGFPPEKAHEYFVKDFAMHFSKPGAWESYVEELKHSGFMQTLGRNRNLSTGEEVSIEANVKYEVIDGKGFIIAALRDISERNKAEAEIRKLSLVAKNTDNGILMMDENRRITWSNESMQRRSGYTQEELLGQSPRMFHYDGTDKTVTARIKKQLMNLETVSEEVQHRSKDGTPYWIDLNIQPIFDESGRHTGFMAVEFDISERKEFELAIAEQNKNLQEITDALNQSALVSVADRKGMILKVNEQFCKVSKYSEAELIGQNHRIINSGVHKKDFWVSVWKKICAGEIWTGEICNRTKDGSLYWVDTVIYPIRDMKGRVERFLSIRSDITARKQAEEREKTRSKNLLERQAALLQLSQIPSTVKFRQKLQEIVKVDGELLQCDRVGFWLFNEENQSIESEIIHALEGLELKEDLEFFVEDFPYLFEQLFSPSGIIMISGKSRNASIKLLRQAYLSHNGVQSLMAVPVRVGNKILGMLSHEYKQDRVTWSEDDINFVRSIADQIALAYENSERLRSEIDLRYKSVLQNILMDISTRYINLPLDEINPVVKQSLERLGQFVNVDRAQIVLYDHAAHTMNCLFEWASEGTPHQIKNLQGLDYRPYSTWTDYHFNGKIFIAEDVDLIETVNLRTDLEKSKVKSIISIPMMDGSHCQGFVNFETVEQIRSFTEDERNLLELFASMLVSVNVRTSYIRQIETSKKEIEQINTNLERLVQEKTQTNLDLAKSIADQEKLVTIGEIAAGIAHDLNTPLGAIKSGAENVRFTLERIFHGTISRCTEEQVQTACFRAMEKESELFIGGLQQMRETNQFKSFLANRYPDLSQEKIEELAPLLVKARIEMDPNPIVEEVVRVDNAVDYLNLIYHIRMVRSFIDTILKSSDRAASVVQDLRAYTKEEKKAEKTTVNLRNNIATVLNIFNFDLKRIARVEFDVPEALTIEAFDVKLFQVWSNLIKNAIEAMEDSDRSGLLKIYTIEEPKHVTVVVENNGPQIPESIRQVVFKKFYTTKAAKNGTGLGLNIVKNIIDDHHASIKLESDEDLTRFSITFNK